eukprot:g13710.t1
MATRMMSSRSTPKKKPVVVDLGSAFIRCGFAGDPRPIHVVPSPIGHSPNQGDACSGGGGSGGSGMARAKEEWVEVLTGVLSKMYTDSLQCRPRERKVVVCESMVSPRALREAVAHVLFRFLQVPSLRLCAGPAPALFCTGLDTGMVLDVGRSEAHVVAVYRGAHLTSSYACAPLGFCAVQERVGELLAEEGGHVAAAAADGGQPERPRPLTSRELEDVVVRSCLVPVDGVPSAEQVAPMELMFAGRRRVVATGAVRTTAVEQALFEGDEEGRSLATLVLDCLSRCPRDCRRALAQNVVVAGGGAMLPGLCARLAQEIRALALASPSPGVADAVAPTAPPPPPPGNPGGYAWARAVISGDEHLDENGDGERGDVRGQHGGGDVGEGEGEGVTQQGGEEAGAGAGAGAGLCVVQVPVRRDHLVWTGASIMASLDRRVAEHSLSLERYLGKGDGGAARLPDWMSVSPGDWLFEAAA